MKLLADLHTHSNNSRFFHGKNTIEEMAIAANEIGLQEIGITDHGYNHICRTNKKKIIEARKMIDEINEWSKTKVLLGVEADIISEDGTIDIDIETLGYLDILLVGYHRFVKTDFAGFFGTQKKTKESIQKVTNAFINAIHKYPITMLTHLDSVLKSDLYQIGCACRDKGVIVEINNRHNDWTEEQVEDLLASGCLFAVSSDAHSREAVGEVSHAFDVINKYKIPSDLITNVEFNEDEKSDESKEIDIYYDFYKKKKAEREEKIKLREEKKKKEFSQSLSKEMEDALQKIADEKGVRLEKNEESEIDEVSFGSIYNADNDNEENENLIREAKEYLGNYSINEFDAQNEKLENVENIVDVDDSNKESDDLENNESFDLNVSESNEQNNFEKTNNQNNQGDILSENLQVNENVENLKPKKAKKTIMKNDIAGLVQQVLNGDEINEKPSENVVIKQEDDEKTEKSNDIKVKGSKFNPLGILNDEDINKG